MIGMTLVPLGSFVARHVGESPRLPGPGRLAGRQDAGSPGRALARKRNDHAGSGGEVYRLSVCLSRNTGGPETFCSCQHGGDLLVLVILLTETSLSFAQGHRGTGTQGHSTRAAGLQTRCATLLPTAVRRRWGGQRCLHQTRLRKSSQKVLPATVCEAS